MRLALIFALMLAGCDATVPRVQTGDGLVVPPAGFIELCMREPNAPECNRK